MKIPLSNPDITESEKAKILEVLNTPRLSSGPKLAEFESKFKDFIGSDYGIAVNSGTSGLHLCVRALGIQDGDSVITTPFSFISSANCILFERARPEFVDIDEKTLNMDIDQLQDKIKQAAGKNTKLKAILPVHVFGRPCEMDEIMDLAHAYGLKVLEDACEAIGAEYLTSGSKPLIKKTLTDKEQKTWQKAGTFGDCAVFAFYPNKQMTTGEGGMIVTDDENLHKLCRSMRNQGRSEEGAWLQHERLGYNYRISDINCALGIAQLARIHELLAKRENVARMYHERLKDMEELILPQPEENKKISWFVYVVRLTDDFSQDERDFVLSKLREKGIGCNGYFTPIHLQPFYRKMFGFKPGDFPITEKVSERTIALPFFNNLKEEQINNVCDNIREVIQNL